MTRDELVGVLHDMYTDAEEGRQVAMIHLFGVRYTAELDSCGASASEIARLATGCKDRRILLPSLGADLGLLGARRRDEATNAHYHDVCSAHGTKRTSGQRRRPPDCSSAPDRRPVRPPRRCGCQRIS